MNIKSICGVIIGSDDPERLARFYSKAFGVSFEEEDHGNLEIHFGLDVGEVHLGIHPLENLNMERAGNSSISVAYNVVSLKEVMANLAELNAVMIISPHDEGFGTVATYKDPDGNYFEIVELDYEFGGA